MKSRLLFLVALAPLLASCNETTVEQRPEKADADAPSAEPPTQVTEETPDAATDEGTCNSLAQVGQKFRVHETTAAPPAPTGGPLADGTYVAVSGTYYGASLKEGRFVGTGRAQTLRFQGNEVQMIADGDTIVRTTSVVVTNGVEMRLELRCMHPDAPGTTNPIGNAKYSAEPGKLRMFTIRGDVTEEFAYEKR